MITAKQNRIIVEQIDKRYKVSFVQRPINEIKIDKVVIREIHTLNSDSFYNKAQVNELLDNKVTVPTQAEWDNFTLTIQGE
jgi:hypothetical protein